MNSRPILAVALVLVSTARLPAQASLNFAFGNDPNGGLLVDTFSQK